jgi:glycosyltransferase involved in cell wall biosynthesis
VVKTLCQYDAYILMSGGENFGHSIFEALSCSLPVIISDQTPWKNLRKEGVGFDLPLDDLSQIVTAIDTFAVMDTEQFNQFRARAHGYAKSILKQQNVALESAAKLFE